MRSLLTFALAALLCASAMAQSAPLTTQQFCDGQQNAMTVLSPLINQFAGYIVPPAGATTTDEQAAMTTLVRNVLGEKCVMLRLGDQISQFQTQLTSLQAKVAALQATVAADHSSISTSTQTAAAAQTNAASAVAAVTAVSASVFKLQAALKSAGTALAAQ